MNGKFACTICGEKKAGLFDTEQHLINHFRREHKREPEALYDIIGRTWDSTLDRLIQNGKSAHAEVQVQRNRIAENETQWKEALRHNTALRKQIKAMDLKLQSIVMICAGPAIQFEQTPMDHTNQG